MPGSTNNIPLIFDTTNNILKEIPSGSQIISDVIPQTIPLDGSVTSSKIASGVSITFGSGSTAVPSIRLGSGNSFVGIYSPSPNVFSIATAGQERLRIDASGNLTLNNGTALDVFSPNYIDSVVNTLYVNQSDANATDHPSNDGGKINKPFKTIERALLEAARRSYKAGQTNDRFEAFTILVMPGEYIIDNRPGLATPVGIVDQGTWNTEALLQANLYKFNPPTGGVIVPRGTSIVGYDLRKTVIRPKFVPNPTYATTLNTPSGVFLDAANMIEKARSYIQEQAYLYADSIVRTTYPSAQITLTCKRDIAYIIDAITYDLRNGGNSASYAAAEAYVDGTSLQFISSQADRDATLATFKYARNIMLYVINNWQAGQVPAGYSFTEITSGKTINQPTFTAGVDFSSVNYDACNPVESAIISLVGDNSNSGIITGIISNPSTYASIYPRNYNTFGLNTQTAIFKVTGGCYFWQMTFKDAKSVISNGVQNFGAGTFTTNSNGEVVAADNNQMFSHHKVVCFAYANQNIGSSGELNTYYKKVDIFDTAIDPGNEPRETRIEEFQIVGPGNTRTTIDTVNSASPYIFNCSLRSIYGICGMDADGSKVAPESFKSMVVAQFTGISLQRDTNAFWQPKSADGIPTNDTNPSDFPIYADPDAEYKPNYRHYHIKAQNSAFIQIVSVFAVGYADQFIAINGGDMSITNSNSNFGQISLRAVGSGLNAFAPSSQGKITALIPPRGFITENNSTPDTTLQEFYGIDYQTTWEKNGQQGDTGKRFNQANLNSFLNQTNTFRIYLSIPGVNTVDDIPELIVESTDYTENVLKKKRYLSFGSASNLNLFRDYYSYTGTVNKDNAVLYSTVESSGGGATSTFSCHIKLTPETDSEKVSSNGNLERQGYFWDDTVKKVYIKVDASYGDSRNFLSNYVFSSVVESLLDTDAITNADGSVSVQQVVRNVAVLNYFTGFPSSLQYQLLVDNRSSNPNDLLWRVEYRIPKSVTTIPKPPEKRFIIKGMVPGRKDDLFQIYDVQEIQSWEKNVKDGIYYLTIIRADIDEFVDSSLLSNINNPIPIIRGNETYTNISKFYGSNTYGYGGVSGLNYRVSSNINYLYPTVLEDSIVSNGIYIWNPPRTDSKVLVEQIGSGVSSYRVKDLSVPNKRYYQSVKTNIVNIIYRNPENKVIPITNVFYPGTGTTIRISTGVSHEYQVNDYLSVFGVTDAVRVNGGTYVTSVASSTQFWCNAQTGVNITEEVSVGLGNTGFATGGSYDIQVQDATGLKAGQTVLVQNNFNEKVNGPTSIQSISNNTIRAIRFGVGVSVTPTNPVYGTISVTPFVEIPSLYSITAEAVSRLASALNLYSLRRGYNEQTDSFTEPYFESVNIDPVPRVAWNKEGSSTAAYPYDYYGFVRYGEETKESKRIFNTYGLNVSESERKIICIGTATTISASTGNTSDTVINLAPTVPLYRPSIIRASSHTWEYIGLGSGNYSTGFPQVQTRVLKPYEQYIAQGYENSGGFVASSGTNSNGDQYVGNQVIQAGGQSTVTLNVPKIRKSAESNYLDVSNIENRISNSVINVTSSTSKNAAAQATLKGLSNFFNTARLSVSDKATINSLTVTDTLIINSNKISKGINFPEGDIKGYGFVKGADPSKTGFISTDTNDKLYVSPKYLEAWRIKKQLVSQSSVQLDNNRIFIEPNSRTLLDGSNTDGSSTDSAIGLTSTSTAIRVVESNGLPKYGSIDIDMNLNYVEFFDKDASGNKLNPKNFISLKYESVDYTNNVLVLSSQQNQYSLSNYISDVIGSGNTFRSFIKNVSNPLDNINNLSEIDPKYVFSRLTQNFTVPNTSFSVGSTSIFIRTTDYNKFPDRGAVVLRENLGTIQQPQLKYVTYVYYKPVGGTSELKLVRKILGNSLNEITSLGTGATFTSTYITGTGAGTSNNVFFAGCSTSVLVSDRWANELPFIPFAESVTEDVDLESATLYQPPQKPIPLTGSVTDDYINKNVPNPYSSKALGVNLQNRSAVKRFQPFTNLSQAATWANRQFNSNDSIELLIKPGYYQVDNATFVPRVKINGSGVSRTGGLSGREQTSVSAGFLGGYTNTDTKRADSVYFYRTPYFGVNFSWRDNRSSAYVPGSFNFKGGFDLQNIHFLGLNEAITENEILDSDYSRDANIVAARRRVRRAYYVKKSTGFPSSDFGVLGGLNFKVNTSTVLGSGATSVGKIDYYVNHDTVIDSNGNPIAASNINCRYIKFTLHSKDFNFGSGVNSQQQKYLWSKRYAIPGSTLYFSTGSTTIVTSTTPHTKILDVAIKNETSQPFSTGSSEFIEIYCGVYRAPNTTSNSFEDLNIQSYTDGTEANITILNKDGDEFNSLAFNTILNYRKSFLSQEFAVSGGFNTTNAFDNFGNPLVRLDTPTIVGILPGYSRNTINLVIDSNKTANDPVPENRLRSFTPDYGSNHSVLIPYGTGSSVNEDFSISVPYFPNGYARFGPYIDYRYYLLQVNASDVSNPENSGMNSSVISLFTSFDGTDILIPEISIRNRNDLIVAAKTNLNAPNCPYKLPNSYSNLTGTATYSFGTGATFTGTITGTGTSFATEVLVGDVLYYGESNTRIGVVQRVLNNTTIQIAANALKLNSDISSATVIKKDTNNNGKPVFINYPFRYRNLMKRFPLVDSNGFGNLSNTLISADTIPGSNVSANLINVTIGAQSPSPPNFNTLGGGYGGGIVRLTGSKLIKSGIRFRGNLNINSTSLFAKSDYTRLGYNFNYGHSVDLFQLEDTNSVGAIGLAGNVGKGLPAQTLSLDRNDEQYKYITEYRSDALNYFEPNFTPAGNKIDYDQRVFPVKCFAGIGRFNSTGELNTSYSIPERYLTPLPITTSTGNTTTNSGWNLRVGAGVSIVGGDSDGNLLERFSITFNYEDADVINNIFSGTAQNSTKIVDANNIRTVYGYVTGVDFNINEVSTGNTKTARIRYSGSIPYGTGITTSLKFLTKYLDTERYKYVSTVTSRYRKFNSNGRSVISLGSFNAIDLDISVGGSGTTSLSRSLVTFTESTGTGASFSAYVEVNSSGQMTSFDPIRFDSIAKNQTFIAGISQLSGFTFTANRNISDDITIYEPGEYITVPEQNVFIVNNIVSLSSLEIKFALQRVKQIIKPQDYILYNGIYYKISKNLPNKSYVGIYRYSNPNNVNDIRTSLVFRLEEVTNRPSYPANQRLDVFTIENLLEYWPQTGKLQIGNAELCDFTITGSGSSNNGFYLNLTRSMTKYFPFYMRDWAGLDPNQSAFISNLLSGGLGAIDIFSTSSGSLQRNEDTVSSIELNLADPVDATCYGIKKIYVTSTTSGIGTTSISTGTGFSCVTPTGRISSTLAVVSVASQNINEDFEKYGIGDIVTIPYRDITVNGWNADVFTVTAPTGIAGTNISSNRAGDTQITATMTAGSASWSDSRQKFHIIPNSSTNYQIYNHVNPLAVVNLANSATSISSGNTYTFTLSNCLFDTISTGTSFNIVPQFKTLENPNPVRLFKSRIIDVIKSTNSIDLILADPLPDVYDSNSRHYGFIVINNAGWTYPRSGGSVFRPNNVFGTFSTTQIVLPNNSGRIKIGDRVSYSYDGGSCVGFISLVNSSYGNYAVCDLNVVSGTHIIYNYYNNPTVWASLSDIVIRHQADNFNYDGPAVNNFFRTTRGTNLSFDNYTVWYENFSNYISQYNGITGRQGFVGNVALNANDGMMTGIKFDSFSSVTWNNQYNYGIWLTANPITPAWANTGLAINYTQLQTNYTGFEGNFVNNVYTPGFINNVGYQLNPILHSSFTTDTYYASLNTSSILAGGLGAYDTSYYQFYTAPNLYYNVKNSTINGSGVVTSGGTGVRVTESVRSGTLSTYKPIYNIDSYSQTASSTISQGVTTVSGFVAGDVLFRYSDNAYIGTIGSDGTTFVSPALVTSGGTVKYISPSRIRDITISGAVNAGTAGPNVIGANIARYNRYNVAFGLAERNYNATPLINTSGQGIAAVSSIDAAYLSIGLVAGDLMSYHSSQLNVGVTNLNPRVHTSRSITISSIAGIPISI